MAVGDERTDYLGKGQLLEPVDTSALTATFKLSQCYPASRYFVLDHSMAPMADMTRRSSRHGCRTARYRPVPPAGPTCS
jgi:hypothetical protein